MLRLPIPVHVPVLQYFNIYVCVQRTTNEAVALPQLPVSCLVCIWLAAPEPVNEKTSDETGTVVTEQTEPTSDTVVPAPDEPPPVGMGDDSPPPTEAQEEESLRGGEGEGVPASAEGRPADDEGKDSVSAESTEELKKSSGDTEAPPSTATPPSGGDGGEGEGGGSMAEVPQTGTQDSGSGREEPDQSSDTGTDGGLGKPAAVSTASHQPGGEGGGGGEQTEVKETAGEEVVQGGEKGRGVEGDPQHSSGDDKRSEPSLGKVGEEGEKKETGGEEQTPRDMDAGAEAGVSDGLQASPQEAEEGESKDPGEQGEAKAVPVAEPSGEKEEKEAPQAAETGPVGEAGGGGGVDQEGPTGAGKEGGSEGEVGKEEVAELPDDFFYDYDSLVSKPEVVDVLPNLLSLQYPPTSSV